MTANPIVVLTKSSQNNPSRDLASNSLKQQQPSTTNRYETEIYTETIGDTNNNDRQQWEYQYDVIEVQHYIQNGRKKTKVKKKKRRVPSCGTS